MAWGKPGNAPERETTTTYSDSYGFSSVFISTNLTSPAHIAVNDVKIYITDRTESKVKIFNTNDGSFDTEFASANPDGIAIDDNFIYVCSNNQSTVKIYNFSGVEQSSTSVNKPYDIAVASSKVYTCGQDDIIRIFTTAMVPVDTFGSTGTGNGQFNSPRGISVSSEHIFVSDLDNENIQRFDLDGNFQTKFGTSGSGDGQFANLEGVFVLGDQSRLYVADKSNNRFQVFDLDGTFKFKFGTAGSGNQQFDTMTDIYFKNDKLYCVDTGNDRVQVYDATFTPTSTTTTLWIQEERVT
jgi:hypothetical protein